MLLKPLNPTEDDATIEQLNSYLFAIALQRAHATRSHVAYIPLATRYQSMGCRMPGAPERGSQFHGQFSSLLSPVSFLSLFLSVSLSFRSLSL